MWRNLVRYNSTPQDYFFDRLDKLKEQREEIFSPPVVEAETEPRLQFFIADTSGGPDQQEILAELTDGAVIDPAVLAGRQVTIYATNEAQDVGSVRLLFQEFDEDGRRVDARFKVENIEPFALFGDTNGDFEGGLDLDGGTYSLYSHFRSCNYSCNYMVLLVDGRLSWA